jgi:hypothetical protein
MLRLCEMAHSPGGPTEPEHDDRVARRADDYGDNEVEDALDGGKTSVEALNAWIVELEREDD